MAKGEKHINKALKNSKGAYDFGLTVCGNKYRKRKYSKARRQLSEAELSSDVVNEFPCEIKNDGNRES